MNEILKKRIENEAERNWMMSGAFEAGARFALSHLWISVEEALPEYEEEILVTYGNDEYSLCHRSKNPNVLTDNNGFCNYWHKEVLAWMPIPKFNPGKTE